MKIIVWTDERIDQLTKLWADHSASEIAAQLGVTRNAVVGKVHRLGLKMPAGVRAVKKAARSRAKAVRNSPARSVDVVQLRRAQLRTIAAPTASIECLNVAFADIRPHKCRWITNDDVRAPLYCGHDTVANTDWCATHYCIVYVPPSDRRRERPKVAA